MKNRNRIILILLTCLSGPLCHAELIINPWAGIFEGIEHATAWTDTPRLQQVNAVRIDLHNPSVSFYSTPANGSSPGDTNRQTVAQFLTTSGVQLAINANFYTTSAAINWNADLTGLAICNSQIVSVPETLPYGGVSLLITQTNLARLEYTTGSSNLTGVWTAVESWPHFLQNGVNLGDPTTASIHPRSALGLTQDSRYLILLTIDGRQTGYSEGATYYETAQWLIRFGAYNGLNLDGGGSTHLAISDGLGGCILLNRPSENRAVGNHLGIFTAPLGADCGDWGYQKADLNRDCRVDITDLALLAHDWLTCTWPDEPACHPL